MAIVKEMKMGEVYPWKVMAEAYPNMWLFLTDRIKDEGGVVIGGRLMAVADYDDDESMQKALKIVKSCNKPYVFYRSTPDNYAINLWC